MRKTIFPIAMILSLGAGIIIGWFAARPGGSDSKRKAVADTSSVEPALEQVGQAEEALRLAGFEQVFVYRWRGALLDGHVIFDTPEGTKRESLDTDVLVKNAFNTQQAQENKPTLYDIANLDLARIRGLIVIAISLKETDASDRACIVAVKIGIVPEGKAETPTSTRPLSTDGFSSPTQRTGGIGSTSTGTWSTFGFSGQVPAQGEGVTNVLSGPGSGALFQLVLPGNKKREIFKLQLRGTTKSK